jgi:hypothetical protein
MSASVEDRIEDISHEDAIARKPGRPRKDEPPKDVPQVVAPPFRPLTLDDVAKNKHRSALDQVFIPIVLPGGVSTMQRVTTLEQLANLDKYPINGRAIDGPMATLALLLGPRGKGVQYRTGAQRAAELVADAKRAMELNARHGG